MTARQIQLNTLANGLYGTVSNNIHYVELSPNGFSGGALGVHLIPLGPSPCCGTG